MRYITTQLLTEDEVSQIRSWVGASKNWMSGTNSQRIANAERKNNIELHPSAESHRRSVALINDALSRNKDFGDFVIPLKTSYITISRTRVGGFYKPHFDTHSLGDFSNTLFLSDPSEYDGGELCLWSDGRVEKVKLKPGMMITYECGIAHQVNEVTRGMRDVAVFWATSEFKNEKLRSAITDLFKCKEIIGATPVLDTVEESQTNPSFLISQVIHTIRRYNHEQ